MYSGPAEDEREAQDVVDLVGVVRAPGGDDGVRAHRAREVGGDLRLRVGQRQDERVRPHLAQPFGLQHARRGQPQEHVGARQCLGQGAHLGGLRIAGHVGLHVRIAPGMHHALDVGQRHVLRAQAHRHQQVDAGECRGARAGGHQPHVGQALVLQLEPVGDGGGAHDGGAVLVVVEHRDAHAGTQLALDAEAFRCLDVFQVDGAEGRLQGGHDVDEAVRVGGVDLQVEHVDVGELLEQDPLALHHRLGRERADVAEPQHRGAVGDHAHQVAARGVGAREVGVGLDGLAGCRDAGGIGECEVALGRHALGRHHRQLSRLRQAVIIQCRPAEVLVHRRSSFS